MAVGFSFGLLTAMTTVILNFLNMNDEKKLWYCAILLAVTNALLGKVMMWSLVTLAVRRRKPSHSARYKSFLLTSVEASFLSGHIIAATTVYISVVCFLVGPSARVILFSIAISVFNIVLVRFIQEPEVEDEPEQGKSIIGEDELL